jgi:hypothetical protein
MLRRAVLSFPQVAWMLLTRLGLDSLLSDAGMAMGDCGGIRFCYVCVCVCFCLFLNCLFVCLFVFFVVFVM